MVSASCLLKEIPAREIVFATKQNHSQEPGEYDGDNTTLRSAKLQPAVILQLERRSLWRSQPFLFSWKEIDEASDLDRLRLVLSALPDESLVSFLEERRGRGRDDYPIRPMLKVLSLSKGGTRSLQVSFSSTHPRQRSCVSCAATANSGSCVVSIRLEEKSPHPVTTPWNAS